MQRIVSFQAPLGVGRYAWRSRGMVSTRNAVHQPYVNRNRAIACLQATENARFVGLYQGEILCNRALNMANISAVGVRESSSLLC